MQEKVLSKKKKILRISLVLFLCVVFVLGMYFLLVYTGQWEEVNTVEKVKSLILSLGFWGRFAFVLFQFLQVTFIPIPSTVLTLAGSIIYGPIQASILSLAGILLGSSVAFFLGRAFGKKLVVFMVGQESYLKWRKFLSNGKYSFAVMMFLPFFPDDVLCLVAGLTDMSWGYFILIQILARPIGIVSTAYLSSGQIIPYSGWGLFVWAGIFIVGIVLIYLTAKYSDKIEKFVAERFGRKK